MERQAFSLNRIQNKAGMRRVGCGICQRGMQEAESILIGSRRIFLGEQEAEEIQTEDQLRAALIRPGDTVTV